MKTAHATYTPINPKRAVVFVDYRDDGREHHSGFSTVEVAFTSELYDKCYDRAEALAAEQGCRLETFKVGEPQFKVSFTNFGYDAQDHFYTLAQAIKYSRDKGFCTAIFEGKKQVATFDTIGGVTIHN
jgi:hypothetical protein